MSILLSTACRAAAVVYGLAIGALSLIQSERLPGTPPYLALETVFDLGPSAVASLAAVAVAPLLVAMLVLLCSPREHPLSALPLRLLLALLLGGGSLVFVIVAVESPLPFFRGIGRVSADHALVYGSLGLLLTLGWRDRVGLGLIAMLGFFLGGILEVLQILVPGRSASGWDLLANSFGLAVGLGFGALLSKRSARRASCRARSHEDRRERAAPRAETPIA